MPGVQRVYGIFARSPQGVSFDSLDGGLTYLFFLLVAPEDSTADHLKALARISRLLKDTAFRARLMKEKTREEIFNAIKEEDRKF
jgi:PTS system nitrogen regulatory IIA component